MALSNDTRGWILTCISAIACIIGSLIICVDVIVRFIPGKRNFKIEENNSFLSSSLSLSFGVMLFSSLNSMLPSARESLEKGGLSPKPASWTLIACFLGGAAGIQIVSYLFHRALPSHIVDCDHSHDDDNLEQGTKYKHDGNNHPREGHHHQHDRDEMQTSSNTNYASFQASGTQDPASKSLLAERHDDTVLHRRPSLQMRLSRGVSKVFSAGKDRCDDDGPCRGFSEPCGQECFNNVFRKGGLRSNSSTLRHPGIGRSTTHPPGLQTTIPTVEEYQPLIRSQESILEPMSSAPVAEQRINEPNPLPASPLVNGSPKSHSNGHPRISPNENSPLLRRTSHHSHLSERSEASSHHHAHSIFQPSHPSASQHHHHVPTNPYLTLSLQTTLAIALHKLPEGFITYAANHASPRLGFTVFFSLFVHNISEGFAMALPLYLALHSRWKAICWSSVLGGASQPLGAGVAALWFGIAGRIGNNDGKSDRDGQGVQGGLIAVTAGIMASVALQLFAQALDKSHNRSLCMVFAFVGMGILSISHAITA
ncbi:hypothetical protein EV356DRAFT_499467 [Viridothelium virens]|uniref:Zinc/iron permease n=1 Tax=Viridothelium virens TaxID=1048519 RepID=A0A6A6HE94_VIRVR|nr:hypothetical protein EV356DRAFT_499467 [Viridothelium virens]